MWFLRLKEAKILARPHDSEAHESAGRTLNCSELKTGGFGLNINLVLLFLFLKYDSEIWSSYSIAHSHKIQIINETKYLLLSSITEATSSAWMFPVMGCFPARLASVSLWNNPRTCLRKESKLCLCNFYLAASANRCLGISLSFSFLKRQKYSDRKPVDDCQELKGTGGCDHKGVAHGGFSTWRFCEVMKLFCILIVVTQIYVLKFMELYIKKSWCMTIYKNLFFFFNETSRLFLKCRKQVAPQISGL